ncbi:MAG TPA: hypothetical protein VGO27_19215 [Candidatus Acidoferrum sp.]|nr:hypothetical protein [Candidatus Acidoferrum sp.]
MKKLEPDSAIFYAFHDAGVSSETALRRAGYKVTNPRSVINQKYKLLQRREGEPNTSVRPAVAALDPTRRAIWDALTKKAQDWIFPDGRIYAENET